MASSNNDDFLTALQLTVCGYLEADSYFSASPRIPVVSEVREDVLEAIARSGGGGMVVIVGLMDGAMVQGGQARMGDRVNLLIRVREVVAQNRSASGSRENALRVAQKVALVLNGKVAAMSTDETPQKMGGTLAVTTIERGAVETDAGGNAVRGINAWHVMLSAHGGGLCDFTRRDAATPEGAP